MRWQEILQRKEAANSAFTLTLSRGVAHGEEKYVQMKFSISLETVCTCVVFNLQWIAFTFDPPGAESGGNPFNGIYREAPTERGQPPSQGLFPGLGKVPGNEVGKGVPFSGKSVI